MAPTTRTSRLTRLARPRLPPRSSAVSATLAKPTKPTTPTTSPPSSSKHWLAVLRGKGIPFPLSTANQCLLELGGDVVGVVGFVGFAKVALTAELGGGRRGLAGRVRRDHRVVGSGHEEIRGIVSAGVACDLVVGGCGKHGHHVLVVAGPAGDIGATCTVDAGEAAADPKIGSAVVGHVLGIRRAGGHGEAVVGPNQAAAAADGGI